MEYSFYPKLLFVLTFLVSYASRYILISWYVVKIIHLKKLKRIVIWTESSQTESVIGQHLCFGSYSVILHFTNPACRSCATVWAAASSERLECATATCVVDWIRYKTPAHHAILELEFRMIWIKFRDRRGMIASCNQGTPPLLRTKKNISSASTLFLCSALPCSGWHVFDVLVFLVVAVLPAMFQCCSVSMFHALFRGRPGVPRACS